ncbi:cysteine protease ATG4D-like [Littorina saxatilis]
MAAANTVGHYNYVSSDKSGSCSDDVLSLDSWSEKLDASASIERQTEIEAKHREFTAGSGSANGSGRSRYSHPITARKPTPSDVMKEKSTFLRSVPPASKQPASESRTDTIQTISGNVHGREHPHTSLSSHRRSVSSTSSDSESSPVHSPRHNMRDPSPSQRIPQTGPGAHGPHHVQFVHHLRPHYQSSPVHRGSPGRPVSSGTNRTQPPHQLFNFHHENDGAHDRGVPYYSGQFAHQNNYAVGNNAPIDQIFEREGEKIKTKMKSMWNNVKYGWTLKTKTSFKYDSPIFLLGRCYHRRAEEGDDQALEPVPPQQTQYKVSALDEFQKDFTSRLWFTYRREFSPIGSAKMTTDCGWGCMMRSGQMMMAQGLVEHFLGRDWKVYSEQKPEDLAFYREIIRWFGDHPSDKMPFSLHRLVELGTSVGKMPGDWYGPASVAHIFRDAMDKAHASLPILSDICVYVAQDCTLYLEDLKKIMTSHSRTNSQISTGSVESDGLHATASSAHPHQQHPPHHHQHQRASRSDSATEGKVRSVLILVPMRLGGETLNEIYIPCVRSMLANDFCLGIIGGRPKHSLYFVGWQDDKLIYLDPHYCQDTVDTTQSHYPIQSFHCMSPRKMHFSKMDPSCTVGFYCRDMRTLHTFVDQVPDMVVPPRQRGSYPLFVVSEGSCVDHHSQMPPARELGRLRIRHVRTDRAGNRVRSPTLDSEDFVIL